MNVQVGIASVGGRYPSRSGDFLTYSASRISAIGATAMKLYFSPNYKGDFDPPYRIDYPGQTYADTYTSLATLAADPAYTTVFNDPNITRYVINTWSFQPTSLNNYWNAELSNAQIDAEYTEMFDLVTYLLSLDIDKEILIANWEGDWQLLGGVDPLNLPIPPRRVHRARAFFRARRNAIHDAIKNNPTSQTRVRMSMECNRVLDTNGPRWHSHVTPHVRPDYVTLSIYEAINFWGDGPPTSVSNIYEFVPKVFKRVREENGSDVQILVSEAGWPENQSNFTDVGNNGGSLLHALCEVSAAEGVNTVLHWQLYDNEEISPGVERGYKVYDQDDATFSQQGRQVYVRCQHPTATFVEYSTETALLADTPVDNTVGHAVDSDAYYVRVGGVWNDAGIPGPG